MSVTKRKSANLDAPIWFDGTNINEALFCDEFLSSRKIIFANGAFFTPDGRVTDDLPLRGEIYEELKCCAVNNIPRKITNILEVMKLAAHVEDFAPEADRIHLANGTLKLDGSFTEGRPNIVRSRLPVAYCPDAPAPVRWLSFLDELPPRILVQVKSKDGDINEQTIQSLKGAMREGDYGLFVTLSNYTKNAQDYLQNTPIIRGINGTELVDLILKYHEALSEKYKKKIPLKMVYIPVPREEE